MKELQKCPFCSLSHPISSFFHENKIFPISQFIFINPKNFHPSRIATDNAALSLKQKIDEQSSKIVELSSELQNLADRLQEKYEELRFLKKDSELNQLALMDLAVSFVEVGNEF